MVSALRRLSVLVALAVLAVSVGLSWLASSVNARAASDLLDRQVEQAATVLGNGVSILQVQLADAGQVVVATEAAPAPFRRFAAARLSSTESFVSLSLLRLGRGDPRSWPRRGRPRCCPTVGWTRTSSTGSHRPGS